MPKRTFQPHVRARHKKHGFRSRMKSKGWQISSCTTPQKRTSQPHARLTARSSNYPRACRLVRRAEFDAVYREGRRRASPSFVVFFRPNGSDITRFGLSVKRAQGGAVKRNRIRRRVREILRLHRQEIAPGWDIVIHPRPQVATAISPRSRRSF